MTDEYTERMSSLITKGLRPYLIFCLFLIVIALWADEIQAFLPTVLGGDSVAIEQSDKIVKLLVTLIPAVIVLLLSFSGDIDIHNLLDSSLFGVRDHTERIIETELIDAARRIGALKTDRIPGRAKLTMQLFYHFANQQAVLRGLAFSYWGRYFKNITIIFYSFITELALLYFLIRRATWDVFLVMPVAMAMIIALLCWRTYSGLVRRIYDLPKAQVAEVLATQPQELRRQIDARF